MPRVLESWLGGWNEVIEAPDDVEKHPGVLNFREVIHNLCLTVEEISTSLKVPLLDLQDLCNSRGYITGDARNNLIEYAEAKNALQDYASRQHGPLELQQRTQQLKH